jgi:hypothetical protein
VSFSDVSVSAIAAALPRLHTLHADSGEGRDSAAVDGFYDDLLPRLQSFHFWGWWPKSDCSAPSQPLPLLRDLKWYGANDRADWIDTPIALPNGFFGSQPESLQVTLPSIAAWLSAVESGTAAYGGPLIRVRDLWLGGHMRIVLSSRFARLLRAAPQLRRLTVEVRTYERESVEEGEAEEAEDPALAEVVHTRLRELVVISDNWPTEWVVTLQQRYFPRARRLIFNDHDFPVTLVM